MMEKESYKPQAGDFSPATKEVSVQKLSRPSLSYWQDAVRRLKKNTRAIISLYVLIGMILFTLIGPFIWQVDFAYQNLDEVSLGPTLGQKVQVIGKQEAYSELIIEDFPAEPEEEVDELLATENIEIIGQPSTRGVILQWAPVEGAAGYVVYRSEIKPEGESLGLPLGETDAGNIVSYEDRLDLKAKEYYYSVVATDGFDESESFKSEKVDVLGAITLADALEIKENAQVGDILRMSAHPLGTDYLGRDMLARLMEGARVSLFIGIVAPLLYVLLGTLYGGISGYLGGRIDTWMMRTADFVVALPFLLFMILFRISFGIGPGESGVLPLLVALVALAWPATARLVRGEILRLREEGYIQAAKLLGAKPFYLLMRHMVPNTMGVILVTLTFAIPSAIFTEAFLSFIGMGVVPPTPSWGSMANEGVKTMMNHPHELIFPSLFISITVLAFNMLGDGLRDALDARMRSRE